MDGLKTAHYRMQCARWGLRGFYLLCAVAAVSIVGFGMFPRLSPFAGPLDLVIWGCAMICILICCGYFVRYLIARRKEGPMNLLLEPQSRRQTMFDRDWRPPKIGWKRTLIGLVVLVFFFRLPSVLHFVFDRFGNIAGGIIALLVLVVAIVSVLRYPGRPAAP